MNRQYFLIVPSLFLFFLSFVGWAAFLSEPPPELGARVSLFIICIAATVSFGICFWSLMEDRE